MCLDVKDRLEPPILEVPGEHWLRARRDAFDRLEEARAAVVVVPVLADRQLDPEIHHRPFHLKP
jgi:hypothetical protein